MSSQVCFGLHKNKEAMRTERKLVLSRVGFDQLEKKKTHNHGQLSLSLSVQKKKNQNFL